jgi:hypothetical protein
MDKRGFEFGFTWIFAIIVGSVILFLAIFTVSRFVDTERTVSDTLIAAELNNVLHPIETNLEDSKYARIEFLDETRVFNECQTFGNFGKQEISTSSKLGIGNDWGRQSIRKSSFNKYIFSRAFEQGREINVIVKPFEIPFKVGDLTVMYSGNYCFVNPLSDIQEEIEDLGSAGDIGIEVVSNPNECLQGKTLVCFNQIGCDINVNTASKLVTHVGREDIFYEGDLIYGAILSDPEIYECQLKRLMKRASELSIIYAKKSNLLIGEGCFNSLQGDLISFASITQIQNSQEFKDNVVQAAKDLGEKNELITKCKVF